MSPLETVKDYFAALNAEDWELMASVLHPELDLIPSGSRPRIGSDKAIAMFQKIFERFPVHQDNPPDSWKPATPWWWRLRLLVRLPMAPRWLSTR